MISYMNNNMISFMSLQTSVNNFTVAFY